MESASDGELAVGRGADDAVSLLLLEIPDWRRLAANDGGAAAHKPARQSAFGRSLGDVHLCRFPRAWSASASARNHEPVSETARGGTPDYNPTRDAFRHLVPSPHDGVDRSR